MASTIETIDFPAGAAAKFSIIDSSRRMIQVPTKFFLGPALDGFDFLPVSPSWSFLIESPTGKKAIFDLSISKDLSVYPPAVQDTIKLMDAEIVGDKDVAQVLTEHGFPLESINSIIISHYHFDHMGDPSTFPDTTEIVVGPGSKEIMLPTYPENENGLLTADSARGKSFREVFFDGSLKFDQYNAIDFFGDGSFYILDTPGHTVGHLGGLVRTSSNPDTFVLLGGDLCHTTGQIRPSPYKPFPEEVRYQSSRSSHVSICSASCFELMQKKRGRSKDDPVFDPMMGDVEEATLTTRKARLPDAQGNLLFISAHDSSLLGVVDFFPKTANDWQSKGIKDKIFWAFMNDMGSYIEQQQ